MDKYINKIIQGDCLEKLKELPDNSVDSICTDPPYGLGFMGKEWDTFDKSQFGKMGEEGENDLKVKKNFNILPRYNSDGLYEFSRDWAKECYRVLKPGGYLLSFAGTRTYHKITMGIEDAGFEVRDMIEWVYSTGFPKSLNLNKALQKKCKCGNMVAYDNERTKQDTEHNLRLMSESDLSQEINPTEEQGEVLQSGLSEQSVSLQQSESTENVRREESLLERGNNIEKTEGELQRSDISEMSKGISSDGEEGRIHNATQTGDGSTFEQTTNENGSSASHRPQSEQQQDREPCAFCKQLGTQETRRLYEATYGVGSALKPAHEPICLARKPLSEKTLVDNFIKYGTGGINIDESRVGTEGGGTHCDNRDADGNCLGHNNAGKSTSGETIHAKETGNERTGRFPANLIHDNSEEVRECFPETGKTGSGKEYKKEYDSTNSWKNTSKEINVTSFADSGNASRFFKSIIYTAKASKSERQKGCEELYWLNGKQIEKELWEKLNQENETNKDNKDFKRHSISRTNIHPTVKNVSLMSYLIKMVTPKGGIVLDPFAGSGSTLVAAKQNGFKYIGIELTEEYIPIIEARLNYTNPHFTFL